MGGGDIILNRVSEARLHTQYIPGYDDYDQMIAKLSAKSLPRKFLIVVLYTHI